MAMQAGISRLSVVTIVAASVTVFSSTGCRSGGGWGGMPGMGWLSRNREQPPPTMLADGDPTGHLPPPSAVADPYSPGGESSSARGSAIASYNNRPAANGYPSTDSGRDQLAQKDPRSYQTGPYNTGAVSPAAPANSGRDRYPAEPSPGAYGSRDLPSGGSGNLPADRWSQQTAQVEGRGTGDTRPAEALPGQAYGSASATYGAGNPQQYAAGGPSYSDRYDAAPADSSDRGSSYPGPVDSAPSSYYGQASTGNDIPDRSMAATGSPAPYTRDLTADPYADAGGVRMADHRADARYQSAPHAPRYGEGTTPSGRSAEPWRPGSTGDYLGNDSSAESRPAPSGLPARGTAQPSGNPADYGSADYGSYAR